MKLKLDENVPSHLAAAPESFSHDVDSVQSEQLTGHGDADVWTAAQQDGRFLITQDLDFSDARKYVPGSHHGLLLVRLRRPGRAALSERIHQLFATEPVETWAGCLVVATEQKVRITRAFRNTVLIGLQGRDWDWGQFAGADERRNRGLSLRYRLWRGSQFIQAST